MHIPVKVDYAVRALVDLSRHSGDKPVHATQVARRMAMPEPYLDHILHTLSKSGFTKTLRGPMGGHSLAMDPGDIKLSMVMAAFNETETIVGCLENTASCTLSDDCGQRNIWQTVEEAVNTILEQTTIADLLKPTISIPVESPRKVTQSV
jgi:Rrf2 family protein